jgi:hypothetical protein
MGTDRREHLVLYREEWWTMMPLEHVGGGGGGEMSRRRAHEARRRGGNWLTENIAAHGGDFIGEHNIPFEHLWRPRESTQSIMLWSTYRFLCKGATIMVIQEGGVKYSFCQCWGLAVAGRPSPKAHPTPTVTALAE